MCPATWRPRGAARQRQRQHVACARTRVLATRRPRPRCGLIDERPPSAQGARAAQGAAQGALAPCPLPAPCLWLAAAPYVADPCLPSPWGLLSPQELQRQLDATSTQVARHRATWLARPPRRNRSRVRQSEHSCACLGRMKNTSARRWSCEQLHLENQAQAQAQARERARKSSCALNHVLHQARPSVASLTSNVFLSLTKSPSPPTACQCQQWASSAPSSSSEQHSAS